MDLLCPHQLLLTRACLQRAWSAAARSGRQRTRPHSAGATRPVGGLPWTLTPFLHCC